jgi:outer membrane protein OmpA-like peptidoglycan-associated protein
MQFVRVSALSFCLLALGSSSAFAAEPVRVHVAGGGTHALGGEQANQFGTGGTGEATVEVPATARVGFQAGAGATVLSKGEPSNNPAVASTGTGAAFMGTVGLRARAFGEGHPGGPWIDSNMGLAHTGNVMRPAFEAHIGWDVRVSSESRIDVGPFIGYTQIFQPDTDIRGTDARLLTAGLSVSLGAKGKPPAASPSQEAPPPVMVEAIIDHDHEELASATDVCPDGETASMEEGCVGEIRIFENRILLEDIIHFEFGSAKIRTSSFRVVKKLAKFIVDHDEIVDVSIEGHTDEVGTDEYNQRLSVERATAMRDLLVTFGAPAKQLHILGFGKSNPKIVTLKPEEQNRRVELFVTVTHEGFQARSGNTSSHGKSAE